MRQAVLHVGDALDVLRGMPEASFDACLTDPPYALTANKKGGTGEASLNLNSPAGCSRIGTGGGFMGQKWDAAIPGPEVWAEVLRVLKPGAFLLAFGGTRTFHRLACAIEDAGFEIRDSILAGAWVYASGMPKALDVSKALDKEAGVEREVVGRRVRRAPALREEPLPLLEVEHPFALALPVPLRALPAAVSMQGIDRQPLPLDGGGQDGRQGGSVAVPRGRRQADKLAQLLIDQSPRHLPNRQSAEPAAPPVEMPAPVRLLAVGQAGQLGRQVAFDGAGEGEVRAARALPAGADRRLALRRPPAGRGKGGRL